MERLELPCHLRGVFFDWLWETSKVWSLSTRTTYLPLPDLAWHLDLTVWTTVRGEPRFDLAPATVLADPEHHARHWGKIQEADLSYPLELFRNGHRWVILDGYHRLARHSTEGNHQIPVRLHPDECRDLIRRGTDS
jgi:hypothetical protein